MWKQNTNYQRGRVAFRWSGVAVAAISCATLLAWTLYGSRADADLAIEVRELEQFAIDVCGFGRPLLTADAGDRFFLERAKTSYVAVLQISARFEVDELTVARGHLRMGMILIACGEPHEAIQPLRTAWSTLRHFERFPVLDEQDGAPDARELAADCAAHLAAVVAAEQADEAEDLFTTAMKCYEAESHRESKHLRISVNLAGTCKAYGDVLMSQQRWRDAERTYLRGQRTCAALLRVAAHPPVVDLLMAQLQKSRMRALERLEDFTEAMLGPDVISYKQPGHSAKIGDGRAGIKPGTGAILVVGNETGPSGHPAERYGIYVIMSAKSLGSPA
jgi:hypothetical protein